MKARKGGGVARGNPSIDFDDDDDDKYYVEGGDADGVNDELNISEDDNNE